MFFFVNILAFDSDNNGFLTFNEFLIGYAITSKGDLKQKLEYAFELYDADNNGVLTSNEINEVVVGMLGISLIGLKLELKRQILLNNLRFIGCRQEN